MEPIITGKLLSVQVGRPQKMQTAQGKVWESAIAKAPVIGPVMVESENITGDRQANRKYHGGPEKAVCGYSAEHYPFWQTEFGLEMPFGAFGENITVSHLTDDVLCLGDVLSVGDVRLQVSQPRMPCANVAKRWNQQRLPERMMATGFTGFYCRVLQTGTIEAGAAITVAERPLPQWTMLRMNRALYDDAATPEEMEALRSVATLTGEWKRALGRKLSKSTDDC